MIVRPPELASPRSSFSRPSPPTPSPSSMRSRQDSERWQHVLVTLYHLLKFLGILYYFTSIPFRLSFHSIPLSTTPTSSSFSLLCIDYLVDLFYLVDYFWEEYSHHGSTKIIPIDSNLDSIETLSIDFMKASRRNSASSLGEFYVTQRYHFLNTKLGFQLLCTFPLEIIAYSTGYPHYLWLRFNRLLRLFYALLYWSNLIKSIESCGIHIRSGWMRVALSCIFQASFSHVAACAYYLLAVYTMQYQKQATTWLSHDNNAILEGDKLVFLQTPNHIYIRALYWAVQTLETVGYGDICAYNIEETIFCIVYFYCALFTLQSTIANIVLLITSQDESRTKYADRTSKFAKFSQSRSLSKRLTDQCQAFYQHQFNILNGVDEHQFVKELPLSLQSRIMGIVIRGMLTKVECLKLLPSYFLSTLVPEVQTELYFPSEVIVSAGSPAVCLYIVSRGIVVKMSSEFSLPGSRNSAATSRVTLLQTLHEGEYFGERSLYADGEMYLLTYQSRSFCEILCLTSSSFKRQCQLYLPFSERESFLISVQHADKSMRRAAKNSRRLEEYPGDENQLDDLEAGNGSIQLFDRGVSQGGAGSTPSEVASRSHFLSPMNETAMDSDSESNQSGAAGIPIKHRRAGLLRHLSLKLEESNVLTKLFHPDSTIIFLWKLLVASCVLYFIFSAPLLLSVSLDDHIVKDNFAVLFLSYLADLVVIINLFMSMFFFPFLREGILLTNPRDIYLNYRSHHFVSIDIIALLPYDLMGIFLGAHLIPTLRLPRLMLVLQSKRYFVEMKGSRMIPKNGKLVILIWWLYMLIHWYGCLFVLAGKLSTRVLHYETNWIITDRNSTIWSFHQSDLSNLTLYFRSIYWALYSASSIGYYDILATNPVETFTVTMILLFGCQMLIGLLGSISSEMQSLTSDQIVFQNKLENTQSLALRKGLSLDLREKLSCYFQYNWDRCKGVDEMLVFTNLPLPLRQAVLNEITGSVFRQIIFFQDCSEGILSAILSSLSPRIFVDGDAVVTAGEYGTEFFVIESGCVHVTSSDRSLVYVILGPGSYLGESCLLGLQTKRTASAYSQGYSYTYALRNIDFASAINPYPEEGKVILRKIKQVLDLKTSKNGANSGGEISLKPELHSIVPDNKHFFYPGSFKRLLWDLLLLFIFLYNMIMIPWRFSLRIDNSLYPIDYTLDLVLYLNLYFIYCKFYTLYLGVYVTDSKGLQNLFLKENFSYSFIACLPFEVVTLAAINQPISLFFLLLRICRLTKLFLLADLSKYASASRNFFDRIHIPYNWNMVIRMILAVCMVGHWAACGFYLLPFYVNGKSIDEGVYDGTWIESQIEMGKLPADGGDQWTLYLRALNWAIPTLTMEVLDDIFAVNNDEMMYSLFVIFFGIILNASIIGTMVSLLTQQERESVDLQIVRQLLEVRKVPKELKSRVIRHLTFMSSPIGKKYLDDEQLLKQLPFSLQLAIIEKTKLPLLNKCPLFDTCREESKKNLCLSLEQEIYSDGDLIIKRGDIGQEMYFLVEGNVNICDDDGVSFTILRPGSFFGETGLVFSDRRMSNVKAIGVCVCYSLNRVHLDNELKVSSETDAKTAFESLQQLLASNQKRNAAVAKNLKSVNTQNTKLSKMIPFVDAKESPLLEMLRNPSSTFCFSWDVLSLLCLFYYALSIPFHLAFLHGPSLLSYRPFLTIDFLIDMFWIFDIYLRYHYFNPDLGHGLSYESEEKKQERTYKSSKRFVFDCIASLPLEIFALFPGTSPVFLYFLRCIHLLRVFSIMKTINLIHLHLDHRDIRVKSPVVMILKSFTLYLLSNHWIACGYFIIHRYLERNNSMTWAIAANLAKYDSDNGTHSICDPSIYYCYLRSFYFVLSTLTSIGYGDIAPYTNIEFCYQIFVVALSGACLNALMCGSFGQYWLSIDSSSILYFQHKLDTIELFARYRKLDDSLKESLIGQFEYVWMLERQTGGYQSNFLTRLPPSLAAEVALALRGDIVKLIPVFKLLDQGRVALGLRPQIFLRNSLIYTRGDISEDIFFIRKGSIRIVLNEDAKTENTRAMYLQRNKFSTTRGVLYKGFHFGEMCLLSPISLHASTALADVNSEVYSLSKAELWKIFLRIPRAEQRIILIKIFTEINGIQHSIFSEEMLNSSSIRLIERTMTSTLDNLYDLSESVLNEIIDEGIRRGNVNSRVKDNEDVFYRILSKENAENRKKLTLCPWYEVLRIYEQKKLDMIIPSSSCADVAESSELSQHFPSVKIEPSHPHLHQVDHLHPLRRSFERSQSAIPSDVRDRIASLFRFMDLDGTGGVSRDELRASLQCLGWSNVSWDDVDNLMTETGVGVATRGSGGDREGVGERLHYEDLVEVIENAILENEKEDCY